MNKYIILKGAEGFGDRLQCLLQAIGYCIKTKRTLVVDWRDPDWYHDETNRVDRYMNISGVDTMTIEQFRDQIKEYQNMSVVPSRWSGDMLLNPEFHKHMYNSEYHLEPSNNVLFDISNGRRPDFDEQIVVSPGVKERSWHYEYSKNLQFSECVRSAVESVKTPDKKQYNVLHMRGGTQQWLGGHHPILEVRKKLKDMYPNMASYVRYLHYSLSKEDPGDQLPLLICSDNKQLIDEWLSVTNIGRPINTTPCDVISSGTHKIHKNQLNHTTKHQLNVELLRDFIIMCNAKHVIHDEVSTFSSMASKCVVTC